MDLIQQPTSQERLIRMESGDMKQTLRTFIQENYLLGRDFAFEDGDSFLERGIIDSIGILQLVTFLQETFGITVQDEELLPDNLDSVDAVTAYLRRKLGDRGWPQEAQESQGGRLAGDAEQPAPQGIPGGRA
jgi:acyl carrier protein